MAADWLLGAVGRPWRTGRKVGRTIYAMVGDTPSDDDTLIGVMDTRSLAQAAVNAHNLASAMADAMPRPCARPGCTVPFLHMHGDGPAVDPATGPCAGCGREPGEHPIHCDGWLDTAPGEAP